MVSAMFTLNIWVTPSQVEKLLVQGDFVTFRKIFNEHLATEAAQQAVREVAAVAQDKMTCLMCYERDPKTCHRQIVATQLKDYDLVSFDLFVDKMDRYELNPEKLPSHNSSKSFAPSEQWAL
ncbi:DUF488 domain-containing protein [Rhizobium sp. NFACC06-2]|uniref:DUF488 domain-containing protein n=1 Tax=Rhizobium sp. NFACC06-2 TaxID=1566264 RepID=UPI000876A038|nr:DUF488 domain-containing protein [Rhizobium sp. NFACC06-2]SCY85520.1 Protein of unknown function, DUF488 [Rhizobium sp. NFACC06-2]